MKKLFLTLFILAYAPFAFGGWAGYGPWSAGVNPVFQGGATFQAASGDALCINLYADDAEDDSDKWRICVANDGDTTLESKTSGSWVAKWTVNNAGAMSSANYDGIIGANTAAAGTFTTGVFNTSSSTVKQIFTTGADQSITAASDTIAPTGSYFRISSDADYVMTSTPTIAAGTDGEMLIIHNKGSFNVTLQDESSLGSSNILLGRAEGLIAPSSVMMLIYDAESTAWEVTSNPNSAVFGTGSNADTLNVRNTSGGVINAGRAVYITGFHAQDRVTIAEADADDSGKVPAIGFTTTSLNNNTNGIVVTFGDLIGLINTVGESVGGGVWLSTTAGAVVFSRPATDNVQRLGTITRVNASGNILVTGAGRINDAPNDLLTATTIGTAYIYRVGGTDVADDDIVDTLTITNISQVADITVTAAEINGIDDCATTELFVGGGAGSAPVCTTASGSDAPLRATSPTIATPTITGNITGDGSYFLQLQNISDSGGSSYHLDGDADYIELADNANLDMDTNDFSVEFHIKPNNVTDTSKRLFSKTDGTKGFEIVINEDDLQVALLDNANNVTLTNLATAVFSADVWASVVITFDRDGNIQAYVGGTTVGSPVSATATATIANASVLRIGTETGGTANEFSGEIDKALMHNRVLSAVEVKRRYNPLFSEPYKYIGASQTAFYDSDFSAGVDNTESTRLTLAGNIDAIGGQDDTLRGTLANGANSHLFQWDDTALGSTDLIGKQVRIEFDIYIPSANSKVDGIMTNALRGGNIIKTPTPDSWTSYVIEGLSRFGTFDFFVMDGAVSNPVDADGDLIYLKNVSFTQIGVALQLEQSGIGHQQWIDVSGNELHGTVSGSVAINLPTNHREKYVDLTVTGDTSFSLPKGYRLTQVIFKETAGNSVGGGVDIGFTNGAAEVVTACAVTANTTSVCAIIAAGSIGETFSTADDIFYISDQDGSGWDAASVIMWFEMERLGVF